MSRQLALKLACIADGDRDWILERLAADERAQLAPLLDEIESLGLAKNPAVIASSLDLFAPTADTAHLPELDEIADVADLDSFWQALLLSHLDTQQRNTAIRKFGIELSETHNINDAPTAITRNIYALLSR